MADSKISALPASTTPLAGTEVLPIVQSGTTKQVSVQNVLSSVQPTGTANGVAFLNASKVLTTGATLVFDGANLGVGVASPIAKLEVGNAITDTVPATYGGTIRVNSATQTTTQAVGGIEFPVAGDGYGYKLQQISNSGANLVFASRSGSAAWTNRLTLDFSGSLGLNTTPDASAIIDVQSTTKGVRMPNMSTTQKNAIASPVAGLMVFDTTLAKLCVYSGAAWQTITSI